MVIGKTSTDKHGGTFGSARKKWLKKTKSEQNDIELVSFHNRTNGSREFYIICPQVL